MPAFRWRKLFTYVLLFQVVIMMLLLSKRIFLNGPASQGSNLEETAFLFQHLDCSRIFAGDEKFIADIVRKGRTVISDFNTTEISDCSDIRRRYFFPRGPLSDEEKQFPIAFAINVYQDYNYIELALSAMYSPQNQYCYHIDVKSDPLFKNRMKRLAECFPNVHISHEAYPVDSRGFNTTRAFLACFRQLLAANAAWKYALTLQVHDFPLHTNLELVRILDKLQGSNDVELREWKHPMPKWMSWDFVDLNILPNSNLFRGKEVLNISKGSVATSLSRAFVEFAVTSIDSTVLLKQLDSFTIADEIFFATINHNLALNPPGGYPGKCLLKGTQLLKPWISRFAIWEGYKIKCRSKQWRHTVCLFGMEDLVTLSNRKELFANKFFPTFDFGAAQCMHELLFNRTYLPQQYPSQVDLTYYENLASVKYLQWRAGASQGEQYNCSYCSDCLH